MTTDATTFAPARTLPSTTPLILGIIAFAFSIALLAVVMTTPDADGSEGPAFSPVAISFTRFVNMRTSELSSVYLETASVRDERPLPPPPPPPAVEVKAPSVAAPAREQVVTKGKLTSTLTFYDCLSQKFCGAMANGQKVYEGAAACSYNLAMGTMFTITGDPTGRVYVCKDRGLLPNTHVDIFWNDPADGWRWQRAVGSRGTIEIVELPR